MAMTAEERKASRSASYYGNLFRIEQNRRREAIRVYETAWKEKLPQNKLNDMLNARGLHDKKGLPNWLVERMHGALSVLFDLHMDKLVFCYEHPAKPGVYMRSDDLIKEGYLHELCYEKAHTMYPNEDGTFTHAFS